MSTAALPLKTIVYETKTVINSKKSLTNRTRPVHLRGQRCLLPALTALAWMHKRLNLVNSDTCPRPTTQVYKPKFRSADGMMGPGSADIMSRRSNKFEMQVRRRRDARRFSRRSARRTPRSCACRR